MIDLNKYITCFFVTIQVGLDFLLRFKTALGKITSGAALPQVDKTIC